MTVWISGKQTSEKKLLSLSPGAIDMVKVIALAAMIIDHINTVLMPVPRLELYALGRAAFPLFTLVWAMHVTRAPQRLQYRANRLWIWAMATQPVFTLTFQGHIPWYALNILFVFASATQVLAWQHRAGHRGMLAGAVLMTLMAWPLMPASYGVPGLVLALSLAIWLSDPPVAGRERPGYIPLFSLLLLNGAPHLLDNTLPALAFAIIPTLLLPPVAVRLAMLVCPSEAPRFMPGTFFWLAYPGHLALLLLIHTLQ